MNKPDIKPDANKGITVLSAEQAAANIKNASVNLNTALGLCGGGFAVGSVITHSGGVGVGRSVFSGGGYTDVPNIVAIDDKTVVIHGFDMREHILQLIKLKGAKSITMTDKKLQGIINTHLIDGDIFACQRELIDAGYEGIANL